MRVLVVDGVSGTMRVVTSTELPALFEPGDLLVVNDTATLPASLANAGTSNGAYDPVALSFASRDEAGDGSNEGEGEEPAAPAPVTTKTVTSGCATTPTTASASLLPAALAAAAAMAARWRRDGDDAARRSAEFSLGPEDELRGRPPRIEAGDRARAACHGHPPAPLCWHRSAEVTSGAASRSAP